MLILNSRDRYEDVWLLKILYIDISKPLIIIAILMCICYPHFYHQANKELQICFINENLHDD